MSDFPYPNHERLDNVIKGIERKYFFSGERSFSGKHESIALVLSRCISFKENDLISLRDIASMQKIDNLLKIYTSEELNRKHRFIGISSSDLLIFLLYKKMFKEIKDGRLITTYKGKVLNTTLNLNGLLSDDFSRENVLAHSNLRNNSIRVLPNITCRVVIEQIDSNGDKKESDSIAVVEKTGSNGDNQESDSTSVIEQSSSNDDKKESDSIAVVEKTGSNGDNQESNSTSVIEQSSSNDDKKDSDSIAVVEQTGSNGDNQESDLKNIVIRHIIVNGIIISIVATLIVILPKII
jgi:ribosomal protein S28E/S33